MNLITLQCPSQTGASSYYQTEELIECNSMEGHLCAFEIDQDGFIGRGGNAIVYRCREYDTGEPFALKVQLAIGEQRLQRFEREIDILRLAKHEQLMTCRATGKLVLRSKKRGCEEHPIVIMPLADVNLFDFIRKSSDLPSEDFLSGQYRGLSGALSVLHEKAIHRDIKPENILIRGNAWLLADFGLCKFLKPQNGNSEITLENERVGPKYWMSPESMNRQIGNGDEITKASDVFQLAAVFWFAATKRHPTGIVRANDWPGPPKMFEVLESALSHDPQSRPQDGREFHERIVTALF